MSAVRSLDDRVVVPASGGEAPDRSKLVLFTLVLVASVANLLLAVATSFVHGQHWAYGAGMIAVGLGGLLVFFLFPGGEENGRLLANYHREDER